MQRNALLGLAVLLLALVGLGAGIVRLAPGADATTAGLGACASLIGAGALVVAVRVGQRGNRGARSLLFFALGVVLVADRLSDRWQLALVALAAGYVGAFLVLVSVRLFGRTRPGHPSPPPDGDANDEGRTSG